MRERKITVTNRAGIHARPAALIVGKIKDFDCNIYFEMNGNQVNAKSIMGVLTMGASYGTQLRILAEGKDEAKAIEALVRLFESKFEEE